MMRLRSRPYGFVDPACPLEPGHPLNRGLVSEWAVAPNSGWRGGLTFRDLARGMHKPNDGTLTNGPTWVGTRGRPGGYGALSFNGSDNYIACPTISHGTTFTAGVWVWYSNAGQSAMFLSKEPVNTNWHVMLEAGSLKQRGASSGASDLIVAAPAANVWHRIIAVYAGTSFTLYVDGVQAGTGTQTAAADGGGAIDFGRYDSGYYYAGLMDDVQLWPGLALTAADVAADYDQSRRGNPDRWRWVGKRTWFVPQVEEGFALRATVLGWN